MGMSLMGIEMRLHIIKYYGLILDLVFLFGELPKAFQKYYTSVYYTLNTDSLVNSSYTTLDTTTIFPPLSQLNHKYYVN